MKTLKLTKLLSLVLACVLLMGALGTLPVLAADSDATIEIVGKNIAFGDTISLAYRVECSDPDAEIEVLLYDAEGNLLGKAAKTVDNAGNVCYISAGVPAHKIDTVVTAVATIKGTDIKSAPMEYSVLEYLYERLEVDYKVVDEEGNHLLVTEEQKAMYEALMTYAIASELVLEKVEDGEEPDRISDYTYFAIQKPGKDVDGQIVKKGTIIPVGAFVTDLIPEEGYELVWDFNGVEELLPEELPAEGYEVKDATVVKLLSREIVTADPTWQLVTDVDKLKAGTQIIIVSSKVDVALSTTQNNNNRGQAEVTKNEDGTLTFGEGVQVITLKVGNKSGTFAFDTGAGYLYAASSSSNYLKTKSDLDDNGSWAITITEDGIATIQAQGTNTRNLLRHNTSSPLFACYGSGQNAVCIYALLP